MALKASGGAQTGEDFVEFGGHRQELQRTVGSFQVFAISFHSSRWRSASSRHTTATYDDVLVNAGPVGIWLWIIAAVGQTLVALVVAQFAARVPDRAR